MQITRQQLLTIAPNAKNRVDTFLPIINDYLDEFGITTRLRVCHFLAQVLHESGELRYMEELASGKAYEGRKDLGNTVPGDGVRFKGRGLIQLTGRTNYKAYSDYLRSTGMKVDLLRTPELLAKPLGATKSAMWYWMTRHLNDLADRDDIVAITRKINGGTNGLTQRKLYYQRAKLVLK